MKYPTLAVQSTSRDMIEAWGGYNHNLRIGANEFYDMRNMTSDHYPVLSPRNSRGVYANPSNPQGIISKDSLCYVDGSDFVMNEYRVDMGLSTAEEDCPKQLISMGAYVIIMPDKKYINTMDLSDFGNIEASVTTTEDVTFELCDIDAAVYSNPTSSATEPASPKNGDLWIDTSSTTSALKKWTDASKMWISIPTVYIKISSLGIGKPFEKYDGVKISGITAESLSSLNNTMVIWEKGDDFIVVVGIMDAGRTVMSAAEGASITIERKMPVMDFITESENRLWGCRYGESATGEIVNEIYCCKLGDFKNWNCFMGLSTDSYAASCGTDGQFTGAITHMGYPLFFKETCLHKVYGNFPANYQVQTTACRGVQKGCDKSLAIVNETLYYKGRNGICAYDGSLPQEVSYAFGNEVYSDAVGGAHGNKYYVSMKDTADMWHLFVYDSVKGAWHKEDDLRAAAFCSCRGEMYCIDYKTKNIITMLGSGDAGETSVDWMVETGEIGIASPDMKYISRLTVRMSMDVGARADFYAQYDLSDEWVHVCTMRGTSLRSFSFPIRPRRCDHMKIRIEGIGSAKVYSLTKTVEQGSEYS